MRVTRIVIGSVLVRMSRIGGGGCAGVTVGYFVGVGIGLVSSCICGGV